MAKMIIKKPDNVSDETVDCYLHQSTLLYNSCPWHNYWRPRTTRPSYSCSIHALIAVCNVQEEIFFVMFLQMPHTSTTCHLSYTILFSAIFDTVKEKFFGLLCQNSFTSACIVLGYFLSMLANGEHEKTSYLKNRQVHILLWTW